MVLSEKRGSAQPEHTNAGSSSGIDEIEFEKAYQKGFRSTLRMVRFLGGNLDMAEEVAQAAWVRGWQYRKQLNHPSLVGAWVNAIARNLYRSLVVLERRNFALEEFAAPSNLLNSIEADSIMKICTEVESRMLRMYYLEGYTTFEIAEQEKVCPTSVRVRLTRIRHGIRERIEMPEFQPAVGQCA